MNSAWGKLALRSRLYDKGSLVFIGFIIFYSVLGFLAMLMEDIAPPHDHFMAALIIFIGLMIHLIVRLRYVVPILIGIGFIPHLLGLYWIFPIYEGGGLGTLYGAPQLGYHYDWFVHGFAMLCYTMAFLFMAYGRLMKGFNNVFITIIIALFFMQGIGALNEQMEYIGYEIFGYGEGFLEFGDGDISPDAGPWQNASMDMVSNFIGSFIGIILFFILRMRLFYIADI